MRIPITAKDRIPGDTPYYGANGIQDYVEGYTHEGEFVLVAEDGATDLDNYPVQLISGLSWVNNHAHVIKAIPDVAQNRFIMHLIKSMDIASYLVGGTRSKLNAEVLMGIELKLPSNSEQIYIGALLSTLDSLITLHQRKCQYRGLYGYLSWEQRKLGELCTISKGHGYSKADIRDAGTPLILYGRLYTQYESRIENVDTFAVEQEGSLLSKGDEVIVPASGETAEDIAVASSVRRSGIIFGGDLNVVTPVSKLDPDYIALAITYSKAHDDLAKRAQGKSVVHVHGNDIAEVEIPYPSGSEQKRISTVVLGLDSLITLHQ